MSLRAKLVLWYTGVFAVSGALLATALYWLIAHRMQGEADYHGALADALEQADQIETLVENLLLLARMDAEAGPPAVRRVDLKALCHDLVEPFAILADQKGVDLQLHCPDGMATEADPVLLRRLFGNLLDNAVRYTPAGGSVTVSGAPADAGCLVTVADTGIGIEPEALEHIFDRFYRGDDSRSREAGGTGLGLSIVKRIVELHAGRIAIDSTPGEGTRVEVWLPTSPTRAAC